VTGAQKTAAKLLVARSEAKGKRVSDSVRKIADAPVRSAQRSGLIQQPRRAAG